MSSISRNGDDHGNRLWMALLWVILAIVLAWLFWAASVIQIEYDDGLASIVNARFLLGASDHWFAQRAPFYPLFLTPAELCSEFLGWERFDLRPYHLWMAFAHGGYLIACFILLRRSLDVSNKAVVIGFLAVILNVVFFSYGPFVNHDILAGLLLLAMLILAERFAQAKTTSLPLLGVMIVLGCVAATMKVTFALLWMLVIAARLLPYVPGIHLQRTSPDRLLLLLAGAAVSAFLAWFAYNWFLEGWNSDIDFERRLFVASTKIRDIFLEFKAARWWMYVPNLAIGYGVTTFLLIVPGAWLALCSDNRLRQSVAIAVVLGFLAMFAIPYREVRYLAFLIPACAFLVIPVVDQLMKQRPWHLIVIGLLLIDLNRGVWAAVHHFQPFYTDSAQSRFLSILEPTPPVTIVTRALSFQAPQASPFLYDSYHRIFHLPGSVLQHIYGWPAERVIAFDDFGFETPKPLENPEQFGKGAVLLFANLSVINATRPEIEIPQEELTQDFLQFSAVVTEVPYTWDGTAYQAANAAQVKQFSFSTEDSRFSFTAIPERVTKEDADQIPGFKESPSLWGYRIRQICRVNGCISVDQSGVDIHSTIDKN